jgi:hypothetical protein
LKTSQLEKEEKARHVVSKTKKHRVAKQNETEADKELLEWRQTDLKLSLQITSSD